MKRIFYILIVVGVLIMQACSGSAANDPAPSSDGVGELIPAAQSDVPLSGAAGQSSASATVPPLCAKTSDADTLAFAAEVIRLTNIERGKVGAAPLKEQSQLTQAAQTHAIDMACHLFVSHTGSDGSSPFDRMLRFGYVYSTAAENIAAGYPTPADVVQGWMNSSGHRTNMLNTAYTQAGVGYVYNSDTKKSNNYLHYWVMTLGKP